MVIDPREAFAGANIPVDVSGKGTLVVTLQVRGMHEDGASCNRQYLAADIIAVREPQAAKPFKKGAYPKRERSFNLPYVPACKPLIQRE